ncbi:endoribonuclease L-PSP [Klebsiella pneumoniae]|uniref:Endoribonuclease L-PSP n=1 Tax=Klebsiella pneumoniae TaxID=573 RepID=A0A378FUE6_KLEPN|nr:endoribonuclease L-PSP [Klebsiella pneumoniae]
MSKTIATENAPAAIGPYVQGVDLGSMIITSGQIRSTRKPAASRKTCPRRRASR